MMTIAERVLDGDRLALARLLTLIENEDPQGLDSLGALYPHTGRAHLVGVTGAPGTGKSTLVNQIVKLLREPPAGVESHAPRVAVIAVDPSSPFSGGAILGDRIRMRDLAGDEGIFIRSMASRGALGGVSRATSGVAAALDAAGYDLVMIETVGAGQAEVDIASTAHTTIVIDAPGLGDVIQANKAGILEIADILVVNKADLSGAENTIRTLEMALSMAQNDRKHANAGTAAGPVWTIPVLGTVATTGEGVVSVVDAIRTHKDYLTSSGHWSLRERSRIQAQILTLLDQRLRTRFLGRLSDGRFSHAVTRVVERECSPDQAVKDLLEEMDP
jgi:LAO/AO transport system kinase